MNERIFVTGATGLVGFNVVRHLLARGYDVVAGVRQSSRKEGLDQLPLQLKKQAGAQTASQVGSLVVASAELLDTDALANAMRGCQRVVHCAGAVDPHARRDDIMRTNVGGTRSALNAAVKAGAAQFIHISSLSVITGQEDQFDVDESAPLRYCGEAYADSKVDAEKVVLNEAGSRINWTILRPGFIYGPGERAWLPRLINNIRTGKAMLIDGGSRQTNVIYVENLARAVELSIANPKAFSETFNLTDGKTPSKKELFDAVSDGLGIPRVQKSVPRPVVKIVCDAVSMVAPLLSPDARKNLSRFSRAAFRLAGVNQGFSVAKAENLLGYTDRIPFEQGMRETLRDFAVSAQSGPGNRVAASAR